MCITIKMRKTELYSLYFLLIEIIKCFAVLKNILHFFIVICLIQNGQAINSKYDENS